MNYIFFVPIIITVVILFFIAKIISNNGKSDYKDSDSQENIALVDEEIENFDKEFFERTQAGESYQHFLSLSSLKDCSLIRGLLQVEGIPSYTEGEHMNNIYGGLSGTMNAVVAIKLYILIKDYETAYDIVRDFINEKVKRIEKESEDNRGKHIASGILVFLAGAPVSIGQESLGIVVLPKDELK